MSLGDDLERAVPLCLTAKRHFWWTDYGPLKAPRKCLTGMMELADQFYAPLPCLDLVAGNECYQQGREAGMEVAKEERGPGCIFAIVLAVWKFEELMAQVALLS
jgi:hypothetical protein